MRIEHSASRLTLRDTPGCLWLFGLVFVASGTFVLGSAPFSREWAGFSGWERTGILVIGVAHLLAGLWLIRQQPTTRLELDRATGTGTFTVRHPGDRAPAVTTFPLSDLQDVRIVEHRDSDGDLRYHVVLALAGGRELRLHGASVQARATVAGWARPLRQFAGLPVPIEPRRPD
jgi:hypothetical protein